MMSTTLIIIFLVYIYISSKNKKRIIEKFESDIKILNETIEKYQIQMHENKNQFLVVSTMIENEKSETKKYINNIVKNEFEYSKDKISRITFYPGSVYKSNKLIKNSLRVKNC